MARKYSREILRILLLIPLLVVMGLLFMWQSKPRFEDSFTRYANLAIDSAYDLKASSKNYATSQSSRQTRDGSDNRESGGTNEPHYSAVNSKEKVLFEFDPNIVNLEELMLLGFSQKQAQGILNYRKAGAIFHTAADFGRCYTVSDDKLQQLLHYINIGAKYRVKQQTQRVSEKEGRGTSISSTAIGGASVENRVEGITDSGRGNASALPRAETSSGKRTASEGQISSGEQSYSGAKISPESGIDKATERYFTPSPIDLNSADSVTLIKVRGIGSLTAQRIIEYRNRMGGFAKIEQLQEIQGMNERNYLSIIQQIFVDSSGITKIDINFALPEQLKGHPYLPSRILNKLLKQRQLKGGWRDTGDLIEQNILSREEAEKLAPYLYFRPITVMNH